MQTDAASEAPFAAEIVASILRACRCRVAWQADKIEQSALSWRRSGLMELTGEAQGPGLVPPVALTAFADLALDALRTLSGSRSLPLSGAALLGERGRLLGLSRRGAVSPNGSCHLFRALDGGIALNLPREDDMDLAAAMVAREVECLDDLAVAIRAMSCERLVERGRLLGLAIARDAWPHVAPRAPLTVSHTGGHLGPQARCSTPPVVVDLSSLWAGPLAASLLRMVGMQVIKVESVARPDGARGGNAAFFDLLNAGKRSVALDFRSDADRAMLRHLVESADIVIEASRPRALRELGIDADALVARGATWLSITGHGRTGKAGDAIAFGDDAGVAGGLSAAMRAVYGTSVIVGDAIADPLTGIVGALATWSAHDAGGGALIDLSMSGLVSSIVCATRVDAATARRWQVVAEADDGDLYPLRSAHARAPTLAEQPVGT